MMLKTSSRKINPFWGMLSFTLRKNIGIIIILSVAALLYCPGRYIIDFVDYYEAYGDSNHISNIMLESFAIFMAVAAGLAVVFCNVMNFTFLYQKRSSDVFHAFPMTRKELLFSRMGAGIVTTLIPLSLSYTSYGIMAAFNSWMGSIAHIAVYFLYTLLIILLCSAFSMIFVVSAGSAFDLVVSMVGGNAALLFVAYIIDYTLSNLLIGYSGTSMSDIMKLLSPIYYCACGMSYLEDYHLYGLDAASIEFIIVSIILIAAFTAISLLLYNRRKAEKGGQAYAYKFMFLICSVLAGICGGYIVGIMFGNDNFSVIFWMFMLIGAIITTVVYGAVTNRGFKNIWQSVIMGGISTVLVATVAISALFGGFGFTNRIPDKDKVDSVYFSAFGEGVLYEDPTLVLNLHNDLLYKGAAVRNVNYTNERIRYVYIIYNLKNGKSMEREFRVIQSRVAATLLDLYKSDARIKMIEDDLDFNTAPTVDFSFYYNDTFYNTYLTNEEAFRFLEIYKQDIKNCDEGVLVDDNYAFDLQWYNKKENNSFYYNLEASNRFTNSYAFIEELDLVNRTYSK